VSRIATVIVGAGPAGLLFSIVARLVHERRGGDPAAWPLLLFDKRASYERTHRLRMAPGPFREIASDLRHPAFDALMAFLERHRFRPEVNRLEEVLAAVALNLGVRRELLCVGPAAGGVTLAELRVRLEREGRLRPDDLLTIVAADSVHSLVRDLVARGAAPVERTHQYLARLRVVGAGLPEGLGVVEQYKLSKVLASILDYRLNANGFAEVDLFLTADEHRAVVALGATPREPVALTGPRLAGLRRAPFFRRVVDRLREGFLGGRCEVSLQSTFCLEHRFMKRVVFPLKDIRAQVFLVGDAAISLPFFRGMACLARCAHRLAEAHSDLVALAAAGARADERLDIERTFLSAGRPVVFGTRPMFGRIIRAEPTVHRGRRAVVVLHRWLMHYGVHVLEREGSGWRSLHHLAPVWRRAAFADFAAQVDPALRYEREVAAVRRAEVAIVGARAWLVRGAREFVRMSAALPFPLQTWFLSLPDRDRRPSRWSLGAVVNLVLAVAGAAAGLAGLLPEDVAGTRRAWLWAVAVPVQIAGGAAYAAARAFEGGSERLTRAVWRIQITALAVGGAVSALRGSVMAWRIVAAASWFLLALPFVAGLYVFELLDRRLWGRAQLEPPFEG
jgi:hypothetical protein